MTILIVDLPSGEQTEIRVKQGGAFYDQNAVIWDERTDGTLPAITLGGMVRSGNALVFDQARKDQHDAVIAAQQAAEQAKTDEAVRIEAIRQEVLSDPEIVQIRAMDSAQIAAHVAAKTTIPELRDMILKLVKIAVVNNEGK